MVKNSTDGPTMIASDSWINLPVGHNLVDHVGVSRLRSGLGTPQGTYEPEPELPLTLYF